MINKTYHYQGAAILGNFFNVYRKEALVRDGQFDICEIKERKSKTERGQEGIAFIRRVVA